MIDDPARSAQPVRIRSEVGSAQLSVANNDKETERRNTNAPSIPRPGRFDSANRLTPMAIFAGQCTIEAPIERIDCGIEDFSGRIQMMRTKCVRIARQSCSGPDELFGFGAAHRLRFVRLKHFE